MWVPEVAFVYSGSTDYNDKNKERVYSNSLGLSGDWNLPNNFNFSAVGGVGYSAINNEIEKTNRSSLADTFLAPGYSVKMGRHSLGLQAGVFLPTSEPTQYEGIKGRYIGTVRLKSKINSFWSVSNKLVGQAIAHTYKYSPTTDELNRKSMSNYTLENTLTAGKFFASLGIGARITTFMDNMSEFGFFNTSSIGARAGHFSLLASYSNISYRDEQRLQPLFFDRYKKIAELSLIYAF